MSRRPNLVPEVTAAGDGTTARSPVPLETYLAALNDPWTTQNLSASLPEAFTRGGRFLELGCGVAGAIVSFLDHYPHLTAVGIDVASDLLEVARARSRALGVDDRAIFLRSDAATFRDPEPFDVVFWPQTFYPEASRADAMAAIFANLRPGGLLVTGYVPPQSRRPDAESLAETGAGHDLQPLLRRLWGIRERSLEALQAELEGAGFTDRTAMVAAPLILPLVKARRPMP